MVQRGLGETAKHVDVDKRFDAVDERLNRIEKLILADHRRRIERPRMR